MEKLHVVTDGSIDSPAEWPAQYNFHVIPLSVQWGEETYIQGKDIDNALFYEMVLRRNQIPKTSLPSLGQVVEFYRSIAKKGEAILSIHLSSKLSGTFAIIEAAARQLAGKLEVIPFDSLAGSAALAFMCREARLLAEKGCSIEEILQRLEVLRKTITIVFTVDHLKFAALSGRVNALQSNLSSLLQIKPIISLNEGELFASEKVRTRSRALDRIINIVEQRMGGSPASLAVVHAADPATAERLGQRLQEIFKIKELITAELSIPVAAHLGPGTIGIVAYPSGKE